VRLKQLWARMSQSQRVLSVAGLGTVWTLVCCCGGVVIVGAIVGPTTSPKASRTTAKVVTTSTPSRNQKAPSPTSPAPSSATTGPRATATPPPPEELRMQLVFSGGLNGQVTKAVNVLPVKKGANYDYHVPSWSTQCVFPADMGAWRAITSFQLNGGNWEISIGQPGFGVPKPGSHPALQETLTGGSSNDPNAVSIMVSSQQPPNEGGYSKGADSYAYYTPQDHNNGAGIVTIDPGLASGTVDIWLTPTWPQNLQFHVTGRWSCR
jgi:hypothetical protein